MASRSRTLSPSRRLVSKHPLENGIDVPQLHLQIKHRLDLLRGHDVHYIGILEQRSVLNSRWSSWERIAFRCTHV